MIRVAIVIAAAILVAFIVIPIGGLFVRLGPADIIAALGTPGALDALRLSAVTTFISLGVTLALGTPLAYRWRAEPFAGDVSSTRSSTCRSSFRPRSRGSPFYWHSAVPARSGRPCGHWASNCRSRPPPWCWRKPSSPRRSTCVLRAAGSRPWTARSKRRRRRWAWGRCARSRSSRFRLRRRPCSAARCSHGPARSGEFGATIMFAGNLAGVSQTLPLAVYLNLESGSITTATALSVVMVAISLAVVLAVRLVDRL